MKDFGLNFTNTNQVMCITTVYYRVQFIMRVAQAISNGVHTEQLIKRYIYVGILVGHILTIHFDAIDWLSFEYCCDSLLISISKHILIVAVVTSFSPFLFS